MSASGGFGGVTECYPFKSRLQEYAQKVSIPTPEYDTVMEGPSHEPVFRSTVTVNGVRYHSLPGFYNRKTAEQSAAEIALYEIHKSGQMDDNAPTVHETGLCKNLLQEYAQKMNLAVPSYVCKKQSSTRTTYCCTVVVGGMQYIGAAANTKKEAEIKAARTALLAIRTSSCESRTQCGSVFTVIPGKRKGKDTEAKPEAANLMKPKKGKFKKKTTKRKFAQDKSKRSKYRKFARRTADEDGTSGMQGEDKMLGLVKYHGDSEDSTMPPISNENIDFMEIPMHDGSGFQTKVVSELNGVNRNGLKYAEGMSQRSWGCEEAAGNCQDGQVIGSLSLPQEANDFEHQYFTGVNDNLSVVVGLQVTGDAQDFYGRLDSPTGAGNGHVFGVSSPLEVSESTLNFGGPFTGLSGDEIFCGQRILGKGQDTKHY